MKMDEPRKSLIAQLLPKTLAGVAAWLLIFAAGMGVSGVALFAYYQYRVSSLEQRLLTFKEEFSKEFDKKSRQFAEVVKTSKAEIEKAAGGVGSKTNEMTKLLEKVGPSVAKVDGIDILGAPAVGTGFVVTSSPNESWILTSFSVVAGAASTQQPVRVRLGTADREATVYSWDDSKDLALVILKVGGLPVIEWAKEEPSIGARIWAVGTAPGRLGASAAEGHLLDVSKDGLLTDADVAPHGAGGPLLSSDGRVLGVLSLRYAPPGFPPSNGWAVPIRLTCQRVLRCPAT